MPPMKDATTVTVHFIWHHCIVQARKTGDLMRLAQVLLNQPQNLYPGDLQLLGKLLAQSKLVGNRGPKSAPIATALDRAAAMYRDKSRHAAQIGKLRAADRDLVIAAEAPLFGVTAEQYEKQLFDKATRFKAAADFASGFVTVTAKQLEDRLKRGPRKPAKRKPAKR
jgi:hypothetical protein